MLKTPEKPSKDDSERTKIEPQFDIFPEAETGMTEAAVERAPEEVKETIKELKVNVAKIFDEPPLKAEEIPSVRQARIEQYQKDHLPDYLHEKPSKLINYLWTRDLKFETEGKENLPKKGPFLVVCNHFGREADALSCAFKDYNLCQGIAKKLWWDSWHGIPKCGIPKWVLKKLGMIPIEESLSNLSKEEKEEACKHQFGWLARIAFKEIIDREEGDKPELMQEYINSVRESVHQFVAVLSRGDVAGYFPEGFWLKPMGLGKACREEAKMKKGYHGIELIAREYKTLIGEELPILPTAFIEDRTTGEKKLVIGETLMLSKNDGEIRGTDWVMAHVAAMLPEEQRGYYKDMVSEKLE